MRKDMTLTAGDKIELSALKSYYLSMTAEDDAAGIPADEGQNYKTMIEEIDE